MKNHLKPIERKSPKREKTGTRLLYQNLVESFDDLVYQLDPEGRYLFINAAGARAIGMGAKEVVGRCLSDIFPAEIADLKMKMIREALDTGKRIKNEYSIMIGGEERYYSTSFRRIPANGKSGPDIVTGISRDITDRKAAEAILRESEERYRRLVELSPEMIMLHKDQKIIYINPAGIKMLGAKNPAELLGKPVLDMVHPDYCEEVVERIQTMEGGEGVPLLEQKYFSLDGRIIDVEAVASPVVSRGERMFLVIARDISPRKKAQKENAILAEISRILSSNLDIGKVYEQFAEKVREVIPFQRISININDPEGTNVIVAFSSGIPIVGRQPGNIFPFSQSATGEVAKWGKGMILHFEDISNLKERFLGLMPTFRAGIRSVMLAPLVSKDRIFGSVIWGSVKRRDYNPGDLKFAESIAFQISGAISNSLLYVRQQQAEAALRGSEEKFRLLYERAPVAYQSLDSQGNIIEVNMQWLETLKYSRKEVMQKYFGDFLTPDSRQRFETNFAKFKMSGTAHGIEYEMIGKDGLIREVSVSGRVAHDNQGKYLQSHCIFSDITGQKAAERRLKESELKYRTLFEAANDAILVLEGDQVIDCNEKTLGLFGYQRGEIIGKKISELSACRQPDGKDSTAETAQRNRSALDDIPQLFEWQYLRSDGSFFDAEVSLDRIELGEKYYLQAIVRDITERKKAEEALRVSERQATSLAHEAEVIAGIGKIIGSTLDLTQVYEQFALEAKKLIDFDRIAINVIHNENKTFSVSVPFSSQNNIPERTPGDNIPLAGTGVEEIARNKGSLLVQEENREQIASRIPGLRPVFAAGFRSMIMVPLISENMVIGVINFMSLRANAYNSRAVKIIERIASQISGAVANARLFAEREEMEKRRRELENQLQQAQKMEAIGQLAGGFAHDFNNSLTIIHASSQLALLDLRERDPLREKIQMVLDAAQRSANLARQLLAFSRRQVMEMKPLYLNDLLRDLNKMLHRVIGEDIDLVYSLSEDLGLIKADPGQIEQAILNIVLNARDAMPDGGKLIIETANIRLDEIYARAHVSVVPGNYILLAITDNGIGIPRENQKRIFEPFFTTKEKEKGTGLGLSTVYGIVKQSGGNIWVYSEPQVGTTFKIYLPRIENTPTQEEKKKIVSEIPRGSETVLIVEDDKRVREMAAEILKRNGYKILQAASAGEALLCMEETQNNVHLLLTDIILPGIRGTQLAERLLKKFPDLAVLYMSGYSDETVFQRGMVKPGENFIQKPFSYEGLLKKVREVLDR